MNDAEERLDRVTGLEDLNDAFSRSEREPIVLFNHDPWCPISARALREMTSVTMPVMIIDVSRQRDVTAELERRTGVRHESPQVLVIRHHEAHWSASHTAITAGKVASAMASAANGLQVVPPCTTTGTAG